MHRYKAKNPELDVAEIMEETTSRKLASIQRIVAISPIEGADRIEVAQILGWKCVISKKDAFKVDDLVVYFEVDSKLPERPEFEFLRERKFRVRTIKLRKQISEGLIMPLSILSKEVLDEYDNFNLPQEGTDLTEILQVKKHDPEGKAERALIAKQKRGPVMRFAMSIPAFRWVYLKLNDKKGPWPSWIEHTDETRIQVCVKKLMEHYDEEWEITEKLDGQSATFFVHLLRVWGFMRKQFGVCSRKIWLKTPTRSKYWETARKYNIESHLRNVSSNNVYIQGEQCGPGIQSNKYKLKAVELYVFNIVQNGVKLSYYAMNQFCKRYKIPIVPLIVETFIPSRDIGEDKTAIEVVEHMVKMSRDNSTLLKRQREGIVIRLKSNPNISLKVINPYFKIEQEKEEDKSEGNEGNEGNDG